MKKTSIVQVSSAIALAAATLLASNAAFAQSGSRLCGWTADLTTQVPDPADKTKTVTKVVGKVGVLYEARTKDKSMNKQCDEAKSDMKKKIDADPTNSSLNWTEITKKTCEDVGKDFTSSSHTNVDMCDYMQAKEPFKVTKKPDQNTHVVTTTYEKQPKDSKTISIGKLF